MSQDADRGRLSPAPPGFERLIEESQARLAERGRVVVGSGSFQAGPLSGSIHSDFGPADQDKDVNQDYVLAWLPDDARQSHGLRLVVAMGDGLTTSFQSEWAAALACSVAARALVEVGPGGPPRERARHAFDEAGLTLGRLTDELARDPAASCPAGQFLSTWKYILKKGGLFQTTLALAWLDRDFLRIAAVGDSGAVWRGYGSLPGQPTVNRVLAKCDRQSHQVCALGPSDPCVGEFDCWREEKASGPFLCGLYTDGIGRALGDQPLTLLDELEGLLAAGEEHAARGYIRQALAERPGDFDDNLTLAVIRSV